MGKFAGFTSVQMTRPQRSQFDLGHWKRMSTRMGRLTPVLLLEAIPSDVFRGGSNILTRLAPMLAPIYDNMTVFVHYFFVPNRLLWSEWEMFITGGRLGPGGTDPVEAPIPPWFDIGDLLQNSVESVQPSGVLDYLGVPDFTEIPAYTDPTLYAGLSLDAMPYYALVKVWQDYYRDRNFVEDNLPFELPATSGQQDPTHYPNGTIDKGNFTRGYLQDYFTSALPFTQRGEEVLIPVDAAVTYMQQSIIKRADNGTPVSNFDILLGTQSAPDFPPGTMGMSNDLGASEQTAVRVENIENISNTTSTINDLRTAWALQVWLERNAVAGSRYNESTMAHFGVRPQDSRLQRPEYIGGGRISIKISPVVSTAYSQDSDDATVPLANLGGYAVSYGSSNRFKYFAPEHGFIIGIASIMNVPSYQQGLPRMFRRKTFLDYVWPTFAKLGEQQIDKSELYASWTNLTPDTAGQLPLFGYTSRYADWKWHPSTNHGEFRGTLLHWTLTRVFADDPELGEEFVLFDSATQDRIFAVNGDEDNFWLYVENDVTVLRALPYFGQPNALGFS